jgi:hypothetical protein
MSLVSKLYSRCFSGADHVGFEIARPIADCRPAGSSHLKLQNERARRSQDSAWSGACCDGTLIGGTAIGNVLTLIFLPALYTIWFRVKPTVREHAQDTEPVFE